MKEEFTTKEAGRKQAKQGRKALVRCLLGERIESREWRVCAIGVNGGAPAGNKRDDGELNLGHRLSGRKRGVWNGS